MDENEPAVATTLGVLGEVRPLASHDGPLVFGQRAASCARRSAAGGMIEAGHLGSSRAGTAPNRPTLRITRLSMPLRTFPCRACAKCASTAAWPAARAVPQEVREQAVEKAEAGEHVTKAVTLTRE
jgi:hypothetical protein